MSLETLGKDIYDSYHGEKLGLGMHGYGSAFFEQAGHTGPKQVDVITIAPDLNKFFEMMKEHHTKDLPLSFLPASIYSWIARRAAGVFYTPFVPFEDSDKISHELKMGVISEQNAIQDLLTWEHGNYIAGRLAKPEHTIATAGGRLFEIARNQNYLSHLRAASLLLNGTFSENELFNAICGISYIGDKRIERGMEKPDKISSIVTKNREAFARIYDPFIRQSINEGLLNADATNNQFTLSSDPQTLNRIIHVELPHRVSEPIPSIVEGNRAEIGREIYKAIYDIVAPVASKQTLKGLLTIGRKMVPYGRSKREKQRETKHDALINPNSGWLSLVASQAGEIAIQKDLSQDSPWTEVIGGIGSALFHGSAMYIRNGDKRESSKKGKLTTEQEFANFMRMIREAA